MIRLPANRPSSIQTTIRADGGSDCVKSTLFGNWASDHDGEPLHIWQALGAALPDRSLS